MCQQGNLYDFKKFVIIHYSTLLLLFQNGQNLKKKKKSGATIQKVGLH